MRKAWGEGIAIMASQTKNKYDRAGLIAAIRAVVSATVWTGDQLVLRNVLLYLKNIAGISLGGSSVKYTGQMTSLEKFVQNELFALSAADPLIAAFNAILPGNPDQAYLDDRVNYTGWRAWTPKFVLNNPYWTTAAAVVVVLLLVAFNGRESIKTVFASGNGNQQQTGGEPQEGDKSATTNDPNAELRKLVMQVTGDHGKLKGEVESLKTDVKNVGKKVDSTSTAVDELKRDLPKMIQDGVSAGLSAQDKARADETRKFVEGGSKLNKLSNQKTQAALTSMLGQIKENEQDNAALEAFADQCLQEVDKLRAERLKSKPLTLYIDGKPVQ